MNSSHPKLLHTGTHRQVPIQETLERLLPLLSRFGITRIANITGLDQVGIPTVVVTRPNARSLSVSQGKGITLDAAKVSGIMEAIEQWHAERISLPLLFGSYVERAREGKIVDPTLLPAYARRWDPDARVLWILAKSLRDGDMLQVPFELVHLDLTLPLPTGSGFFPVGSNGLASGNSLQEAILHGACELIERDAIARFYQMPPATQAARRVQLTSINDPTCRALLARYEAAGVGVAVWDITSDLAVPTFFCSAIEKELNPFRSVGLARGFGCHPDSGVALSRALSEAAQSRLTRIAGSRDDFQADEVAQIREQQAIVAQQQQLAEGELAEHDFRTIASTCFQFVEQDLAWLNDNLAKQDLCGIHYVDLTRAELGIAVARVLIPGLEGAPDVPGYVAGRRALEARGGAA